MVETNDHTEPEKGLRDSNDESDAVVETPPSQQQSADPPPDGGLKAWLQVVGAFFVLFNPWGMINAYGAFQTYYNTALDRSASDIAWIGTFQGFLVMFLSGLVGSLFDKGYFRILMFTGTFLITFGMMMLSLSTEYYQVFLAQGVVVGVGSSLLSVPGLAIISQYFSKRRGLATGIAAAGGSVGALLYPIIFERLQTRISFAWATRVIGFVALATLLISCALLRTRLPPATKARALFDSSAFRNFEFVGITLGMFLYLMGLYVPIYYVSLYAQQVLGMEEELAFYLLAILNAASIFGRTVPGPIADKVGPLNLTIPMTAFAGLIQYAWISVNSSAGVIVFCVFYGFCAGAYVTLVGSLCATIAPQPDKVATWMGQQFLVSSLGLLIGNPIGGSLLKNGSFVPLQIYGGSMIFAAFVVFCVVRIVKFRRGVTWSMKC